MYCNIAKFATNGLLSHNIDKAFLSKALRWVTYDQCRDDEKGKEDIIEVKTVELLKLKGN